MDRLMRCENGNPTATPGCGCGYCEAVFDEWGKAAEGFQRWYQSLTPEQARRFFGEVRRA